MWSVVNTASPASLQISAPRAFGQQLCPETAPTEANEHKRHFGSLVYDTSSAVELAFTARKSVQKYADTRLTEPFVRQHVMSQSCQTHNTRREEARSTLTLRASRCLWRALSPFRSSRQGCPVSSQNYIKRTRAVPEVDHHRPYADQDKALPSPGLKRARVARRCGAVLSP